MRHLTDGEREIVAELERDAQPDWEPTDECCPECGAPDDAPGGCRCWVAPVDALVGPTDDDDLPF